MRYWTDADTDAIEIFVERVLERVADGTDDVETAKVDFLSLLAAKDRKSAREAVFGAKCLLRMWASANAPRS